MPLPAPQWEIKSFQLELPRETMHQEAHDAGKRYLEQMLGFHTPRFDYSCKGSKPHPTMSGMRIFRYSYKVRAGS